MDAEKPSVRLRLNALCASLSEAMPREKLRAGGPQFAGDCSLPVIPAWPEMLCRFANSGWTDVRSRLKWYAPYTNRRWLKRCDQLMFAFRPRIPVASTNPNRLTSPARELSRLKLP